MKTLFSISLLAASVSAQEMLVTDAPKTNTTVSSFGNMVHETIFEDMIHKVITKPTIPFAMDYAQQTQNIERITKMVNNLKEMGQQTNQQPYYTCDSRNPLDYPETDAGQFFPIYTGDISPQNPSVQFTGRCFDFDVQYVSTGEFTFDVEVTTSNPKTLLCKDFLFFGNTELFHFDTFFMHGLHKFSFDMTNDTNAQIDFNFGGLKIFQFCAGVEDTFLSLFHFLEAFVGGLSDHPLIPYVGSHTPPYMEKANLKFLHDAMGLVIEERETYEVHISPDLISSGDYFLIMRLDGLDPLIMYGTGAHGAHCVMALRFEGDPELYIVESQDAWYWPTAGLQRTPYHKWIQQAKEASFNVIWLPLSGPSMRKFDQKKANDWFYQTEGLPYGYHNFIYGWIDTVSDNLPPLLPNELAPIVFSMLEAVMPKTIQNMFAAGMNKRLGTEGLNMKGVAAAAAEKGMSIQDVMAMVEQDGWIYTGLEPRDGMAFVCSAYTASVWKAAGIFGDDEINATEWTPRDMYVADVFDKNFNRPQQCIDADPNLPYCQLIGKYRIDITHEWSSVKTYAHMNEHCGSYYPDYARQPGC